MRYIITVDQGAIRKELPAIHIHDTETDRRANATEVFLGPSCIVQGPMRQDGARVWVETDRATVVH